MKLIKKIARTIPLVFLLALFVAGVFFGYGFIKDISYRKGLIEVYENSDTIVTATLFRINSIGSGSGRTYYLRYVYVDGEGKRYEGDYKPYMLDTWEQAEFYLDSTIEIKIYDGKSYPADYGYPSYLGSHIMMPLFWGMALFALILIPVRITALKDEGKLTAKQLLFEVI